LDSLTYKEEDVEQESNIIKKEENFFVKRLTFDKNQLFDRIVEIDNYIVFLCNYIEKRIKLAKNVCYFL
jgi:hypothetical protein